MDSVLTDEIRHFLLTIIQNNADIGDLHSLGYSYSQITKFINVEIESGYAVFNDNRIELTDKGLELKKQLAESLELSKWEQIVTPKLSGKLNHKLQASSLFIPDENELNF